MQFVSSEEFAVILNNCIKEITNQLRVASPAGSPHVLMMRSLLETAMSLQVNTNYSNVIALLQKVKLNCKVSYSSIISKGLEGLLEGMNPPPSDPEMFVSFRDCHILMLRALQVQFLLDCYCKSSNNFSISSL